VSSSNVRPKLLSARERAIAAALSEAVMPGGHGIEGGGSITVERLERFMAGGGPLFEHGVRAGLWTAEMWTMPRYGRPLSRLPLQRREHAVEQWSRTRSRHLRWLLRAILTPIKGAHFDAPEVFEQIGCRYSVEPPANLERQRWMQQVSSGRDIDEDLQLECEVVVVGTGAGGAAAAYELAKRGRAVLMLESGDYHTRADFTGRPTAAYHGMYLDHGLTVALGNIGAPVWAGRCVGGSTTINSGTCYRAPDRTLKRWHQRYGLSMLTTDVLAPYFEQVEGMLDVGVAQAEHLGGPARVVARGAELMGLSHKPLQRNAPGCDGQGVCCFGCPTGAKRSTDISYVPAALERGAQLITGANVKSVEIAAGRARGVTARLASGRRLIVRAEAVVVACGTFLTPQLLRRSGACVSSGWLGKNLSIHPAAKVMALFDEHIDPSRGIPQSYTIDEHADDGLMFEGGSTPIDVTAMSIPWVGDRFMETIGQYQHLATFGFMIQDHSRGEVRAGPRGAPLILYNQSRRDTARMQRGIEILSEVFLHAGARRVMPMAYGCDEIRTQADLNALREKKLRAGDFEITAFHPLGTCRIGTDAQRSCIGPDHQAHDTRGLYVTDGSAIPSSLGVNPQMTIMAMALRAAEMLDAHLDSTSDTLTRDSKPSSSEADRAVGFEFDETMSGSYSRLDEPQRQLSISFTIRARSRHARAFVRRRVVDIEGVVDAEGLATAQPLRGTLGLDVLLTGRLPYDFEFSGDDGERYRFAGHKTVRVMRLLKSMTTLPAKIFDDSGEVIATADLLFDAGNDMVEFLKSWRLWRRR